MPFIGFTTAVAPRTPATLLDILFFGFVYSCTNKFVPDDEIRIGNGVDNEDTVDDEEAFDEEEAVDDVEVELDEELNEDI